MYTVGVTWSWKMSADLLGNSLLFISVRPQLLFKVIVDDATPAQPFWDKCSDSSDTIPTYVLGSRIVSVQRLQFLRPSRRYTCSS